MNCINCNKEIPNGITICPNCGSKTNSSSIIMPTESEPRTMPSGGINNGNIDIPLFKTENNTAPATEKKENTKSPIMTVIIIGAIIVFSAFVIFGIIIPSLKSDEPSTEEEVVMETIIGDDKYGYLSLPGDWNEYEGEENTAMQYINSDGWIVSMGTIEQTDEEETAENFAKFFVEDLDDSEDTVEKISSIETVVAEYTAYLVSCHYTYDDIWLYEWFFEPGDDKVHYIAMEVPKKSTDLTSIIETFSLTEIK